MRGGTREISNFEKTREIGMRKRLIFKKKQGKPHKGAYITYWLLDVAADKLGWILQVGSNGMDDNLNGTICVHLRSILI